MDIQSESFVGHVLSLSTLKFIYYLYIITHKKSGDKSLIHKNKKIIIHPLTLIFFVLIFASLPREEAAVTRIASVTHELGHIFCAYALGAKIRSIAVYPFGADIKAENSLSSYSSDIILALSGPFVNLALAFAGYYLNFGEFFVTYNLCLMMLNLLPVKGLDGGVVFFSLFGYLFGILCAERLLRIFTFAFLIFMWVIAVYVVFVKNGAPSLFVISVTLFFSVFLSKGNF